MKLYVVCAIDNENSARIINIVSAHFEKPDIVCFDMECFEVEVPDFDIYLVDPKNCCVEALAFFNSDYAQEYAFEQNTTYRTIPLLCESVNSPKRTLERELALIRSKLSEHELDLIRDNPTLL